jgi:hemerythrin-like domain-containing protein
MIKYCKQEDHQVINSLLILYNNVIINNLNNQLNYYKINKFIDIYLDIK